MIVLGALELPASQWNVPASLVISIWNIFFQLIFDESFTYFYVSPHRWHDFDFFLPPYAASGIQTHVSSVAPPLRDLFQDTFTFTKLLRPRQHLEHSSMWC